MIVAVLLLLLGSATPLHQMTISMEFPMIRHIVITKVMT
jgi:hypothetical protein